MLPTQESFSFGFESQLQDDDFVVSESNAYAFSFLRSWPDWKSNIALIYGPPACGKTHLTRIWQNMTHARYISPVQIYSNDYNPANCYILENIEQVHDEAAFFHFFNSVKEHNGFLLMTAYKIPSNLGIRLADLRSRLNAIPSFAILSPDDELLRTMFVKQFTDRQLKVEMEVINYLIARMERSFEFLYQMVDMLDKKALKERKNITIPFVKKVLGEAKDSV